MSRSFDRRRNLFPTACCVRNIAVLAVLATVFGCGGGEALYPVEGQVSVEGTPLPKGTVTLWSEGAGQADPPGGEVQNGKFTVYTKGRAGAPEGKYKVTVSANEEVDSTKPFKTKSLIPANFREKTKTPLMVSVGPSQSTKNVDLAVKSK